jgi:hypothetical protein
MVRAPVSKTDWFPCRINLKAHVEMTRCLPVVDTGLHQPSRTPYLNGFYVVGRERAVQA